MIVNNVTLITSIKHSFNRIILIQTLSPTLYAIYQDSDIKCTTKSTNITSLPITILHYVKNNIVKVGIVIATEILSHITLLNNSLNGFLFCIYP